MAEHKPIDMPTAKRMTEVSNAIVVACTPRAAHEALQLMQSLRDLGYALAEAIISVDSDASAFDSIARNKLIIVCIAADFEAHDAFLNRIIDAKRPEQQPVLVLRDIYLEQLPPRFLIHCLSSYLEWSTPTSVSANAVPILEEFVSASGNHPLVSYAKEQAAMPLIEVEFTLRQVAQGDLNELGKLGLDFVFEGYRDHDSREVREAAHRIQEYAKQHGVDHQFDLTRDRRFAGDKSLARGKYYTVAEDQSGSDRGVLVAELMAYYNPLHSGIIEIYDLTVPAYKQVFQRRYGLEICRRAGVSLPEDGLVVVYFLPSCKAHPFGHLVSSNQTLAFITIPVTVTTQRIPGVLDLRQPAVADWFAKHFSSLVWNRDGVNVPVFPNKEPVSNFREILPSLLTQQLGGGGFTKVVGWWLRRHGVRGLVFPSARYDSSLKASNGKCVSFSGWNLVDYRGSSLGDVDLRIDVSSTWPDIIENSPDGLLDALMGKQPVRYTDVDLKYTRTGEAAGSWEVTGLVARRLATTQVAKVFSQLAGLEISDESKRVLGSWLLSMQPNQARTAHADVLIWALLGVEQAKADILAWKSAAESGKHHELAGAFDDVVKNSRVFPSQSGYE